MMHNRNGSTVGVILMNILKNFIIVLSYAVLIMIWHKYDTEWLRFCSIDRKELLLYVAIGGAIFNTNQVLLVKGF